MPLIEKDSYRPPFYLRNGHINTIYSTSLRRAPKFNYNRSMIRTVDNDVLVVDKLSRGHSRLAVLCHGLEGSAESSYIRSMSYGLFKQGYDILAINFRSCGGVMNHQLRMYHSGETRDMDMVLKYYQSAYEYIVLVGFSLGGNVVLKYLGQDPEKVHHKVKAGIAVSVPIDLKGSSEEIGKGKNYIYQELFLKSLKKKIRSKHKMFPDKVILSDLKKVKKLIDFDEFFTAPFHGFKNADDYYQQSNSGQFLFDIQIPTLLINAEDDPFLSPTCYPHKLAKHSNALFFHAPKFGGHVGFSNPGQLDYHEEMSFDFLREYITYPVE